MSKGSRLIGDVYRACKIDVFELWTTPRDSVAMSATSSTVSIHANDLEASAEFYKQMFGMERMPQPAFAFPVAGSASASAAALFVRSGRAGAASAIMGVGNRR